MGTLWTLPVVIEFVWTFCTHGWWERPTCCNWIRSCGKVIFSQAFVILSTEGGVSQHALGQTPPEDNPPQAGSCCRQYATYWNAFLYLKIISRTPLDTHRLNQTNFVLSDWNISFSAKIKLSPFISFLGKFIVVSGWKYFLFRKTQTFAIYFSPQVSCHCFSFITVRKRSCGKVMCLPQCMLELPPPPRADTPMGRHLPPGQPPRQTPPYPVHAGIHTPPSQCMLGYTPSSPPAQYMLGYTVPSACWGRHGYYWGRYASYRNAFLFLIFAKDVFLIDNHINVSMSHSLFTTF